MRVLLVAPLVHLPIETRTSPPLGLAYLAAVSERRGDEVRLYDGNVEKRNLADIVREFDPAIVGISANTIQIKSAWRDASVVRDVSDAAVVLGGPHPSVLPEESLAQPGVDFVVRGEGEDTWIDLCGALEGRPREQWAEVAANVLGITYRDGDQVRHTRPRPPIKDLDGLPFPAYHHFQMERYTNLQPTIDAPRVPSYPILTSRGCPYHCSYCCQTGPRLWRPRSPESVVAEWSWLVRDRGAKEIGVLDDSFNIDRKRVLAICDLLIKEGLQHVPWIMINGIRANLADVELLTRMREAGCVRTAFGVESGNQRILDDAIDKKLTLDQVRKAFEAARAAKMETIGFFIVGLPGETEETMDETIRFACELDPLVANFSMATPFPGTRMYEQVKQNGHILVKDYDDYAFFEGKAAFEMPGLPAELVERKWKEAYRRFYWRPSRIARQLTRWSTYRDLPRTVRVAWRTAFG
ncbi:MAG: radical SAM protein [Anaerolineae bacterium]|nr:radical SAM protein [Anaerolineae bacterium]